MKKQNRKLKIGVFAAVHLLFIGAVLYLAYNIGKKEALPVDYFGHEFQTLSNAADIRIHLDSSLFGDIYKIKFKVEEVNLRSFLNKSNCEERDMRDVGESEINHFAQRSWSTWWWNPVYRSHAIFCEFDTDGFRGKLYAIQDKEISNVYIEMSNGN